MKKRIAKKIMKNKDKLNYTPRQVEAAARKMQAAEKSKSEEK